MRRQKHQLFLIGLIVFIHNQIVALVNMGKLWLNPRVLLWPVMVPCCVWFLGELVKIKKQVDYEDDLYPYYLCNVFLWDDY